MSTLAARVDDPRQTEPHPASRHRRNKQGPGRYPARSKIMENHDDRSHFSSDSLLSKWSHPSSRPSTCVFCRPWMPLPKSRMRNAVPAWAAAQSPARARSLSPADAREEQIARKDGTDRALTMSLSQHGEGVREGRAGTQAVVAGQPSAPLVSEEHKMIAFAHASQRFVSRAVAKALDLVSSLRDVLVEVRENRRKIEARAVPQPISPLV